MNGKIKRLVRDRGFGFIEGERGRDLFFHRSAVEGGNFDELHEGQSVEFDVESDNRGKGPRATNIRPLAA